MMDPEQISIEEERTLTATRLLAIGALAAGAGLAAWSVLHAAKTPGAKERAREIANAAKRVYAHPKRVARGNGKAIGRSALETFANAAAKAIAGRLALALFQMAVFGRDGESEAVDFPLETPQPLPA